MSFALITKIAIVILGAYVVFAGIQRRRSVSTGFRRDPAVDLLLKLLLLIGVTFVISIILSGAARLHAWPNWIRGAVDVIMTLALIAAFIMGPVLGWKLVGEQDRNVRR